MYKQKKLTPILRKPTPKSLMKKGMPKTSAKVWSNNHINQTFVK